MAEHKVPQDIEAEDKILGPFSFRQFIYLLIAAGAAFVAFFLGRILLPLAILPVPIILFFLILALPLRKDQPMETYLSAMIRFLFSPRTRLWDPDGSESMVEITNPPIDDDPISRKIKGDDAVNRLSLLSDIEDSQGWVTRGIINNTSLNDDLVTTANQTVDVLDDSSVADQFNAMLAKSDQTLRENVINQMNSARVSTVQTPINPKPDANSEINPAQSDEASIEALLRKNRDLETQTEDDIRQKVIQPLDVEDQIAQNDVAINPNLTSNIPLKTENTSQVDQPLAESPKSAIINDEESGDDQVKIIKPNQDAELLRNSDDEFEIDLH